VFIIGKGPSLDAIDLKALPAGTVINLNDSERILQGDICVFSSNWVRHSLREPGFRCRYYLAGKPLPPGVPHAVLPPTPIELDDDDLLTLRLERSEFFDDPFVLLNAVKIALRLSELKEAPIEVFLLGFDFTTSAGLLSSKVGFDYSQSGAGERAAVIAAQERDFIQFLRLFQAGDRLKLCHVGNKPFSRLTCAAFNRTICGVGAGKGTRPIDYGNPDRVLIVAELTNNHLGDPKRLVEMIERSKDAGADLIKVQKRDVDSFYTDEQLASYYWSPFGTTLRDYRRGVELGDELLNLVDETCRGLDIDWFSSVLDYRSFEALRKYNLPLLKVPSTISNHTGFHAKVATAYNGPIVVSTGLTDAAYVDYVLNTFRSSSIMYLLHCISAYPTPRGACNIGVVREYFAMARSSGRVLPGYSSHDLGSAACMLAVSAGARMLEKHVKLGDVDWVHFDKVAIDLRGNEFSSFVRDVRQAEEIVGSSEKRVMECEHHKYVPTGKDL
jgi:N-acetylneuraminate synthase